LSSGVKLDTLACRCLSGSAEARVTSGVARWLRRKYEWLYVNANLFRMPSRSAVNVKRARKTGLLTCIYYMALWYTRQISLNFESGGYKFLMLYESVKPYIKDKLLCDVIVNTFTICHTLPSRFFYPLVLQRYDFHFASNIVWKIYFHIYRMISGGSENNSIFIFM